MNRIREGYVRWTNPFSKTICQVSLKPDDVSAIVFWSKNYLPLVPHLDELDVGGYRMLFHFTITGLPRVFEPRVPETGELVECARVPRPARKVLAQPCHCGCEPPVNTLHLSLAHACVLLMAPKGFGARTTLYAVLGPGSGNSPIRLVASTTHGH